MSVHVYNGVLRNDQHAVNSFIDLGEFEAMKMLSGRRALCCSKHQFRAKTMAST